MGTWHLTEIHPFITACQWSCRKIMLSVQSVSQGSHVTTTYDALDLTIDAPPSGHGISLHRDPLPSPLLVTFQTCSPEEPLPPYCHLCGYWRTYGWQAGGTHPTRTLSCWYLCRSYWKTSNFSKFCVIHDLIMVTIFWWEPYGLSYVRSLAGGGPGE